MHRIPMKPKSPERVCWGCEKYCPAEDLRCGNGTIRTPHPVELFGPDWAEDDADPTERLTTAFRNSTGPDIRPIPAAV